LKFFATRRNPNPGQIYIPRINMLLMISVMLGIDVRSSRRVGVGLRHFREPEPWWLTAMMGFVRHLESLERSPFAAAAGT